MTRFRFFSTLRSMTKLPSLLAAVCAVHCALTPLIVLAIPSFEVMFPGAGFWGEVFETSLLWVLIFLSAYASVTLREKVFIASTVVLFVSLGLSTEPSFVGAHHALTFIGSGLLMVGQWLHHHRQSQCCQHSSHGEHPQEPTNAPQKEARTSGE